MELLEVFISSFLIGLSIAAPVGPIGVLTIQRSVYQGPRAGLATGLGAAVADAVFFTTLVLTLSNPATILSFVAIFGAMAGRSAVTAPGTMVLGVLLGSATWWLFLSTVVGRLRERFDARWQRRISLGSAAVLAIFAV